MMKRKCFLCGGFGQYHIACNYRNVDSEKKEGLIPISSNKFKVLKSRLMNIEEDREISKDRKTILREERLKGEKSVKVQKTGVEKNDNRVETKEKLLREITVKI